MFNQMAIEVAVQEREREIREAVRRRRLLAGEGADPQVEHDAAAARALRREWRRLHPARVAAP